MGINFGRKRRDWMKGFSTKNPNKNKDMVPVRMGSECINLSKKVVHEAGLKHLAIHIVVISEDGKRILLVQRANKKMYPKMWDIAVGRHIEVGNGTPNEVARKAFKEEIQHRWGSVIMNVKLSEIFPFTIENESRVNNEEVMVYLMKRDDIDISIINKNINKKEAIEAKWVTIEEFKTYLSEKNIVPHKYLERMENYMSFNELCRILEDEEKQYESELCESEYKLR